MKVRKNKHRIMERMANPPFSHDTKTMWHIRDTPKCNTYSGWCPDCNARLFIKTYNRFPYTQAEWWAFDQAQNDKALAEENKHD